MQNPWQLLIRNALVFDGTGSAPRQEDVAVADGRIAARGPALDPARAERVLDVAGRWLMPGLVDIHTHIQKQYESVLDLVRQEMEKITGDRFEMSSTSVDEETLATLHDFP